MLKTCESAVQKLSTGWLKFQPLSPANNIKKTYGWKKTLLTTIYALSFRSTSTTIIKSPTLLFDSFSPSSTTLTNTITN